jgi:CRP/FNR family transcriptional regulator, dissimilatory nitrate respiration regulator
MSKTVLASKPVQSIAFTRAKINSLSIPTSALIAVHALWFVRLKPSHRLQTCRSSGRVTFKKPRIISGCSIDPVDLKARIALLRQTAAFRHANSDALLELARASQWRAVSHNEVLFLEHDASPRVFVVLKGTARSYSTRGSRELTLGLYGARQVLGLIAVFLEPPLHTASADMLEDGAVLEVDAATLRGMAARDVVLAMQLLTFVAARFARLASRADELVLSDLNSRLARLLLEHDAASGWALPTNSRLAAHLGTVPELVSRKLGEFYKRGWIRLEKRTVFITDTTEIKRLVESLE